MSIVSINSINVSALEALVEKTDDEFTSMTGFNGAEQSEMATALRAMMVEERQTKVKQAAGEFIKLFKLADQTVGVTVESIRAHRRKVTAEVERVKRITRAKAYGAATMNMLPLLSALKGDNNHMVPTDWFDSATDTITKSDIVGKN